MLLIDGVKYELWTPRKEVEEFQPLVKEHYKEIFGKNSIFIEGNRLESESGKGSVPDGFVVTLGEVPQWHIVEMELSTHQLYDHIVNQVGRFIGGVKNTATRKNIIEAIYHHIQENKQRKAEFEEAIGSGEIYKLLTDIISKSPVLTIIIEKRTLELDEAIDLLKYSPIEIVEFQTFVREGVGLPVHAHLFEPIYQGPPKSKPPIEIPEVSSRNQLYQRFFGELIEKYCRRYPSRSMLKALPQNWLGFGAGKAGFWFNWAFKANRRFSVELIIQTEDSVKNKQYFDRIKGTEAQLGIAGVSWERLDDKKSSRVAVYTNGDIQEVMSDELAKDRLIEWAIGTMKNFSDNVKGVVKTL
jgi:hypothetical protein